MKRIGWFTSGRDEAALKLFEVVIQAIKEKFLPIEIAYVFSSKEERESEYVRQIFSIAKKEGIKTFSLSASFFERDLKKQDRERWREKYHRKVYEILAKEKIDFGVLAGYMLIVPNFFCEKIFLINLHPALPGGPKGTWQEVIWSLISARACETGIMMHRVTPNLDEGPPVTFVRFSLRTSEFVPFWEETEKILLKHHLTGLKKLEGEKNRLFQKIRKEGVKRELPFILLTLKFLAEKENIVFEKDLPFDLTEEVERFLQASPIKLPPLE